MAIDIAQLQATISADLGGLLKGASTTKSVMAGVKATMSSAMSTVAEGAALAVAGINRIGPSAAAGFSVLTGNYEQLGNVLRALPGPIGEIGGAIGDSLGRAISDTSKYADTVDKLSQRIGESAQFTSSFVEASDDMRVSQDVVNQSLSILAKNLGGVMDADAAAATGGRGLAAVFKDQGIATGTFSTTLYSLADRIHELGPGMEASKLATQAFGRAGQEMLPVLLQGSEGIKQLQQAAIDAGLAMDEKGVKGMRDLAKSADDLGDRITAVERRLTVQLAPGLINAATAFSNYIDNAGKAQANTDLYARYVESATGAQKFWNELLGGTTTQVSLASEAVGMGTLRLLEYQQALADAGTSARTMSDEQAAAYGAIVAGIDQTGSAFDRYMQNLQDQRLATHTAAVSFQEYSDASQRLVDRQQDIDRVMGNTGAAVEDMATKIGRLGGAIDGNFSKLTKVQEAQTAYKLATGEVTVQQFEQEQAMGALSAAYVNGKLSLEQFVTSSKALATGNSAEPFFAMTKAGGETNAAVLGVVKQIRSVEEAAGVSGGSVLTYADNLKLVTGSYKSNSDAAGNYQKALVANEVYQLQSQKTMSDLHEQYAKGQISVEQYAAAKVADSQADAAQRTALEAAAKAATAAGDGMVYYARVVGGASEGAANLGAKVQADADSYSRLADATDRAATAASNYSTVVAGLPTAPNQGVANPGGMLDPLQRMMQGQQGNLGGVTTAAGEIPAGVAQGITANQQQALDAMTAMATGMQDVFKASWGIKSPSTVAAGYSNDVNAGFAGGLTSSQALVVSAMAAMATAGANAWTTGPWFAAGVGAADQLLAGIDSRQSAIYARFKAIAEKALADILGEYGKGRERAYGNP